MIIYRCTKDGCSSLSDKEKCSFCGNMTWREADSSSLYSEEWERLFAHADIPEDKFRVAKAWAETGDAQGVLLLAEMYMSGGEAWKKDEKQAVELLQQLVEKRNPEALCLLGSCCLTGAGIAADPKRGIELLWKACDMKNGDAAYLLGVLYENGTYVIQDNRRAEKMYKRAAENGSEDGMLAYGKVLMKKAKTENETGRAFFWVWRAACEDLGEAQLALGLALSASTYPINDIDQAIYWISRAAENECDGAASALAQVCLRHGDENPYEPDDLLLRLRLALDRGDLEAAKTLGDFYKDGILVDPDPIRAYKFYRMGQGAHKGCSASVAHCYHYGIGVEKNIGMTHCILSDMIDLDSPLVEKDVPLSAIVELGDMYRDGEGVTADSQKAASLYAFAASCGSPAALGRVGREALSGNKFIKPDKNTNPILLLRQACVNGDAESALFLTKHYLAAGDKDQAYFFMTEALFWRDKYTGGNIESFARDNFPELLKETK